MGGDASGIRAGRAYVELYGNDDGLTDVLNRAEGMIGAWSARLKGAGSAVASTFGAAITSVVSTVAAAGAATVALGSAGLAAMGFGVQSARSAAGTLEVVAALESLRSVGTRAWDFLSSSVGRGSVAFRGVGRLVGVLAAQVQPLAAKFSEVARQIQAIADAAQRATTTAKAMPASKPKGRVGQFVADLTNEGSRLVSSVHGELSGAYPKLMGGVDAIASGTAAAIRVVTSRLLTELRNVQKQLNDKGSVQSQLAAAAGKSAARGQWVTAITGDKDAHKFYTEARAVADGAIVAAAYSKSFISGIETRLKIGGRRAVSSGLAGLGSLANTLSMGALGAVANVGRGVARSIGVLPKLIDQVGTSAASTRSPLKVLTDGLNAAANGAKRLFGQIAGKGAILAGLAGSVVGMGSIAAGFDMRSIGDRLMNSKSFAKGASDLEKRGNALVSSADVEKANALKHAMETLFQAGEAAWAQIGAALAPIMTESLTATAQWVAGLAKWLSANRDLAASIFRVSLRIFQIATAVSVVAKIGAILAPALALVLTPLGAIAVALTGGVALWAWWSGSGGKAIAWLTARFGSVASIFGQSWKGIIDAVSSGDLGLAGQIACAGLELAFLETIRALGGSWTKFQSFWFQTVSLIGDAWDVVLTRFQTGWRSAQNGVAKGITYLLGLLEWRDVAEELKTLDKMAAHDNKQTNKRHDDSMAKRAAKLQKQLAELQASDTKKIEELRAELARLTKRAAAAREATPAFDAVDPPGKIKESAITGTFNAMATVGMGNGSVMYDIRNATKKTAEMLQKIREMKQQGYVFGGGTL